MFLDVIHSYSTPGIRLADLLTQESSIDELGVGLVCHHFVAKSLLMQQIATSAFALPIILCAGLLEAAIRTWDGEGMEALAEMAESLKNHVIYWIPISLIGIFLSLQKIHELILPKSMLLAKYDSNIFFNRNNCPDVLDLSGMANLLSLNASDCGQIRTLELGNNRNLTTLDLSGNRLTSLPDSILELSSDCNVDVTDNRFSPEYIATFRQRFTAYRNLHPSLGPNICFTREAVGGPALPILNMSNLSTELSRWPFSAPIDSAPLLALDQNQRSLLGTYLFKLKGTEDYSAGGASRQNIIRRTENMLRLMSTNQEFREITLAIIFDGLGACGDRVIYSFNDIEVQWQVYNKQHTESELASLLVRIEQHELLKIHAKKQAVRRQLGDQIETVLYYQLYLKNELNLPITTQGMLYPNMAGVTPDMLLAAKNEILAFSKVELLSRSELWQKHLKIAHAAQFNQLEEYYGDQINDLSPDMPSEEYLEACNRIPLEREAALNNLARQLTENVAI